ncbi:gephyrin-like molybdotransferase Glp [Pacificoceanicola onchidii]|uniref:molybdenum cofactor synthesis domain-containing protein n=1 Tax=Pacificoceanicola onchidii TaxID=2562685 RepID=UPI0010A5F4F2|nr:gephyrin-like molybdotransferase Glp [Pacificoceanicola onchidii]
MFNHFTVVDWNAGNDTGPRPKKDAIWIGEAGQAPRYHRNRISAEDALTARIESALVRGERMMIGFDFPFSYPRRFIETITGHPDPFSFWAYLEQHIEDGPKSNNRFDLAGRLNQVTGGRGPFWGNGLKRDIPGLPRTQTGYHNPFPDRRTCEVAAKGTFTVWQMSGAGSVGSQVFMGLPVLERIRQRFARQIAVWPFEPLDKPIALVEIWPGLINPAVRAATGPDDIRDAVQVKMLAGALANLAPARLHAMLDVEAPLEGSILGLGYEQELEAAVSLKPPPLRNDCFALPPGVNWTPVDDALDMLKNRLSCVVEPENAPLGDAMGRVLSEDVTACRSNPPTPNTAVDGYGFAAASLPEGDAILPLVDGRSAAGAPYAGTVPSGSAVRVLTGAALPDGVDTVVLDEDSTVLDGHVAFRGSIKPGANTRKAGEDAKAGETVLPKGQQITPAGLALAASVGCATLPVFRPLRVAVLSTGDEVVEPGSPAEPGQIFDANRPMLLGMIRRFGFEAVDMGRVPDDRPALRQRLDEAAQQADMILTSGGASAGDEDHVSALLQEAGAMQEWRIALKPGRPLALGLWNGAPVFGLPGNPVAAFVCTLIFARPAMGVLAGQDWRAPQGFDVPAAFSKNKKPGRREYLRARVRDGRAEVFKSEGSGRISGLNWGEGLVELGDEARNIATGDLVRFIPYGSFGL